MPGPAQPYVGSGGENLRRLVCRMLYLRAVGLVAPDAAQRLWDDVGGHYAAFLEDTGLTRTPYSELLAMTRRSSVAALVEALKVWVARYHLDEWAAEAALEHLHLAHTQGSTVPLGSVAHGGYWQPALVVTPPAYRPEEQTRAQYLAAAQEYAAAMEAKYKRAGWSPAAPPGEIVKHLLWLARRDVLCMTWDKIMQAAVDDAGTDKPPDQSTIRKGIEHARSAIA